MMLSGAHGSWIIARATNAGMPFHHLLYHAKHQRLQCYIRMITRSNAKVFIPTNHIHETGGCNHIGTIYTI